MNEVTNLISEALELLPSVKNANSSNYPRLVAIYSEINKIEVRCSPCIYYTVISYFEAFNHNTTYQTKTMATTKYKVLPDRKGNERTSFMFMGATYPVAILTDAIIEKMIKSGSFFLGTHFAIIDEAEASDNGDYKVCVGDTTKVIQEPIITEEVTETPKAKRRGRK